MVAALPPRLTSIEKEQVMSMLSRRSRAALALSVAFAVPACADTAPDAERDASLGTAVTASHAASWSADGAYRRASIGRGSPFHATNGVRVGPDGNLYVASVLSRSITIVDRETGAILDTLGVAQGVESPDDLAFGPDGSLYWTAFFTGEIGRLSPSGQKTTIANLGKGVNAIAFSPEGRLFVARDFLGDDLWEVDPAGVAPPRLVASGLGGLNAMSFGPDGQLYGPLWFLGVVARVDVETGARTTIASGLATPSAVKFDPSGRLHALDQARGQLLRIDAATGDKVVVGEPGIGADNFDFDAEGRAYVTNSHDGSITELRHHGHPQTLVRGGIIAPGGVAVLPGGDHDTLYVADSLAMRVLDGRTGHELEVLHSIIGVTPLAVPLTASADGSHVLTSSWFSNAVQVYDPASGAVLESHKDFAVPLNAVRFQGDLVVAEVGSHTLSRKDHVTGAKTVIAGLPVPTGLAVSGDSLYAADWATGRVLEIYAGGALLSPARLVAAGVSRPEGLAVDRDGSLLVVETGTGSLLRIDPATGARSVVETGLNVGLPGTAGLPPTFVFNGVAVGAAGDIYVTLDRENQIARLTPRDELED
jgi:sugar lactone lactonase YvrE